MIALFGELIDVPPFLVNNTLSSGDSNVIRRENKWPANDETGPRAPTPPLGVLLGQAGSDHFTDIYNAL